jgi:hypothetical protein
MSAADETYRAARRVEIAGLKVAAAGGDERAAMAARALETIGDITRIDRDAVDWDELDDELGDEEET